ncbi:hypothetical protein JHN55_12975 [Streptomyces sp. MBT56]|uniref:hypothetical protein n=1 Tax=unclassified Streptomyces TaxID=2593676 RepID=UPI00190A6F2B|nr:MULTISPECIES: hypothetical protein [unclassified Streptomyces]MBK3557426.1 hypothetical protein [Streptomyces sp. MBT56]MBK3604768.1 hypothetical protein [Streptomyces sp. MBT54]MBK3618128.1 hypothetical protein [Streptomyces sp. MBT98]MBK6046222.1 hypothetical protein [Streptomyces sp. MBT55]
MTRTLRRTRGIQLALTGALLAGLSLLTTAGPALADDPSASASLSGDEAGPTEAGTTFRTATALKQGRSGTAQASAGDYLYWVFPADAGQRPTVEATVKLPESAARRGTSTWQVDVYDGLRRRQACMYGHQTRKAAADAATVELSCVLRPVRSWSEPWANDPLAGSYYIRLTVVDLPAADLGLPVDVEVRTSIKELGGGHDGGGALAEPLVPGVSVTSAGETDDGRASAAPRTLATGAPGDGWASGWWTDRWLWTVGGGVLAALAAVFGYSLTRGRGRPAHVPPGI